MAHHLSPGKFNLFHSQPAALVACTKCISINHRRCRSWRAHCLCQDVPSLCIIPTKAKSLFFNALFLLFVPTLCAYSLVFANPKQLVAFTAVVHLPEILNMNAPFHVVQPHFVFAGFSEVLSGFFSAAKNLSAHYQFPCIRRAT